MYTIITMENIGRAKEIASQYGSKLSFEMIRWKDNNYAVIQCDSIAALVLIQTEMEVELE